MSLSTLSTPSKSTSSNGNSTSVIHQDGIKLSTEIIVKILENLPQLNHLELELSCREIFLAQNATDILAKYDNSKNRTKKAERNVYDMLTSISTPKLTPNQMKNQAIRFGIDETSSKQQKSSWSTLQNTRNLFMKSSYNSNPNESRDYEEVINPDILKAPITDICIISKNEPVPDGFYRISKTPQNYRANLNAGSGGNVIFICIKKDLRGESIPITAFIVFYPDKNEFVPPGFFPVKRGKHACNMNSGTSAERIYLAYKKDKIGNPLTDIQVIFPGKDEEIPRSFCLIDKSPTGISANLNAGTGGGKIAICYKQNLIRLECLLHEPVGDREFMTRESPMKSTRKENRGSGKHTAIPTVLSASATFNSSPTPIAVSTSSTVIMPKSSSTGNLVYSHAESNEKSPAKEMLSLDDSILADGLRGEKEDEMAVDDLKNEEDGTSPVNDQLSEGYDDIDDFESMSVDESTSVSNRENLLVVDSDGKLAPSISRKCLYAILSALYAHHEELTVNSLSGLTSLLKDSNFFENDLKNLPLQGTITMLDVTIEAVCDRFDTCTEAMHENILQFLRVLIRYSSGRFTAASVRKIYRSFIYLCGYYSTRSSWMFVPPYLPVTETGSDMLVFKVLKELIWATVAQVETVDVATTLPDDNNYNTSLGHGTDPMSIVNCLTCEIIDETIESVEMSRLVDNIALILGKQSLTTSSWAFWEQSKLFSKRLFDDHPYRTSFTVLSAICKSAWLPVRMVANTEDPNARDLGNKLLALESLYEFCFAAGEKMKLSKVMGYVIRRLVVPCLLFNVPYSLSDHRVFSKILKIITALWKVWRVHIRIEFAILSEYLMTKILQASQLATKPIYQMIVLQEVVTWFDQPYLLLEMFVNYDLDSKFVSHWNVFSYLLRAVCAIARRTSNVTNAWNWRPASSLNSLDTKLNGVTFREVHTYALEEVARIAKTLMDATGHAYLITQDSKFRARTLGNGLGWEEDYHYSPSNSIRQRGDSNDSTTSFHGDDNQDATHKLQSVRFRRAIHQESEELIKEAIKIYKEKDSIKKAVQYLVSKEFMANTPQEVASFLRVYKNHFDPTAIGEFLGEGGVTPQEVEYWAQIRFRYIRAVTFIDLDLEPALRILLTECGFRLPGEAQKIDRMVEVFVKIFWQDNHGTSYCPFSHPDTVHLVTYAMIMLNTDLHRANRDQKRKRKKMTKEEFMNNLRGVDKGKDIDSAYLSKIYDHIKDHPIELPYNDSEQSHGPSSSAAGGTNGVNTTGGNNASTNNHGNNLSGGASSSSGGVNVNQNDIEVEISAKVSQSDEKSFQRDVVRGLRDAEDLLRSLSPYTYHFQLTGIDTNISLDLVSFMYETVWFHFHAITDSLLVSSATNDMNVTFAALDILCYSLTSSIFLDLKVEKMTFATHLLEFRELCEPKANHLVSRQITDDSWFQDIEDSTPETAMETIAKLHKLIVHMKDAIQESNNYELTRLVAAKIEKRAKVLEHNTFFVREGDLTKRNRSGRLVVYRFFLFSDHLIYAHQTMSGEYKVHESLPLSSMTVSDVDNDPSGCSFYVNHPTKSFLIIAESPAAKQAWLHDTVQTISSCKKREMTLSTGSSMQRRMSIIGRIEDQQVFQMRQQDSLQKVLKKSHGHNSSGGSSAERLGKSQDRHLGRLDALATLSEEIGDLPMVPEETGEDDFDDDDNDDDDDENGSSPNYLGNSATKMISNEKADTSSMITAQQRQANRSQKIRLFEDNVEHLDDRQLKSLFNGGVDFWKGMLESRGGGSLEENVKMRLYGLYRQAKYGPCTLANQVEQQSLESGPPIASAQLQAWRDCSDIDPLDAKRYFLISLYQAAPYWKYEQFI